MTTRREFIRSAFMGIAAVRFSPAEQAQIRSIAGTGVAGSADGADAISSQVNNPYGVVVGPDGALYFCDLDNSRIRRLDFRTRKLSTVAGNGHKGYSGDGGPALEGSLNMPHEVRFDAAGNLFIVERDNHVVRRVDAKSKVMTTLAGTGTAGFGGDGGPAARAQLNQPHSIAFDAQGDLLICDIRNSRIRRVDMKTGRIDTFAGTGNREATPDEAPLDGAPLNGPRSMDSDPAGNLYLVLREGNALFKIDGRRKLLKRIAGTGQNGYSGDGGPGLSARFAGPKGVAFAADQSLYVADTENHVIRRLDLKTGVISTVAGTGERGAGIDGDPLKCKLSRPHGVFFDKGSLYIGDSENHAIRLLSPLSA